MIAEIGKQNEMKRRQLILVVDDDEETAKMLNRILELRVRCRHSNEWQSGASSAWKTVKPGIELDKE